MGDVKEDDLRPVRVQDDWGVVRILDLLPQAEDSSQSLGLLLVAAAVTQGAGRVLEMAAKTEALIHQAVPRLNGLIEHPGVLAHREVLGQLVEAGRWALEELPEIRARASNELDVEVSRPYGLRPLDLKVLAGHVRTAVGAYEMTRRPTMAGVRFGRRLFEGAPAPDLGKAWLKRIFKSGPPRGVQFFWPPDYGRLLLVCEDGRLADDPGQPEEAAVTRPGPP